MGVLKMLGRYLPMIVFEVMLLSGCANVPHPDSIATSVDLELPKCNGEEKVGWHLFSYNLESGRHKQITYDKQVVDSFPTMSPNGENVAFVRDGSTIEILEMATGRITPILERDGHYSDLRWSPDGRKLAFVSDWDGAKYVYLVDADGANITRATNRTSPEWGPAWLSDGQQISFLSPSSSITNTVAVYTASLISPNVAKEMLTRFCRPTEQNICASFYSAAWSPDGKNLATITESSKWGFVAAPEGHSRMLSEQQGSSIVVFPENDQPITVAWMMLGEFRALMWAPDAKQVLYHYNCLCGSEEIGIIDIHSGLVHTVVTAAEVGHILADPVWSPDGKTILYSRLACMR